MKTLYVLYDVNCAFCCRCRAWMENHPAYFEIHFIPAHSPEADQKIPGIDQFTGNNELTVVTDEGAVYQGPNAFIMCLYALEEFREWSIRLARPALLPFARKAFDFISSHRAGFSKWLENSPDDAMATVLQRYPSPACGNGTTSCIAPIKRKLN